MILLQHRIKDEKGRTGLRSNNWETEQSELFDFQEHQPVVRHGIKKLCLKSFSFFILLHSPVINDVFSTKSI